LGYKIHSLLNQKHRFMKLKITHFFIAISLISCSIEEEDASTTLTQENLSVTIGEEAMPQAPHFRFDNDQKGLYQGTITTLHQDFHEKITINLGNDGAYNAFIKKNDGKTYFFTTQETVASEVLTFYGKLGNFKVSITEENTVDVFDANIQGHTAIATVVKDLSYQRMIPSIGSFTSNDGSITGSWDFTFAQTSSLGFSITSTTIFVNQNSETFVLNISGDYQRLCSAPGTPVPIGVVNSSFFNIQSSNNVPLGASNLNFTFVANRLESTNAGCRDFPSAPLDISAASWTWNGIQGISSVETSSLPDFSGI